jgi:hypothetical protein
MDAGEVSLVPDQSVAPTDEQIIELQRALSALPQTEPITTHYFADGMCCRTVFRTARTLVVGKVHKKEHFFVLVQGEMTVWTTEGSKRAHAPYVWVCKPGTKRVTYAHTDATAMTVHRVSTTDLAKMEEELVEDDPSSNYGVANTLRAPALESEK